MAVAAARAARTGFVCEVCGASAPKWAGRCDACGAWNSLLEAAGSIGRPVAVVSPPALLRLDPAASGERPRRRSSGYAEVDRVLGGGFVPGSVTLLGGDPGIGKSTLALQIAAAAGIGGQPALYCSGEESAAQVGMRAQRLGCDPGGLSLLIENDLDAVIAAITAAGAPLTVVDSVQTLCDPAVAGSAGSPGQVRNAVSRLVAVAKHCEAALLLVGHVTKEGAIAGPRTLEHLVDVVLYLDGERLADHRVLRGVKNRFGSTGEAGFLEMAADGMRQVDGPGRAVVNDAALGIAGSALTISCDGVRPLAVEVQALVLKTGYAIPRRTVSGFDLSRLHLLLAVLQKRGRVALAQLDVFLNVVGGVQLSDPGADLAVALAVAAAERDRALDPGCVALGELGLGGEVRRVHRLDARLREAAALGIDRAIVPAASRADVPTGMQLRRVRTLADALRAA